jgi:3-oxoacyl-(acyl-carrier-protein) synthase
MPARRQRVVITGVGPVTPIGVGVEAFWGAALAGRSGVQALTELPGGFPVESLRSRVVARVPDSELPEAGLGARDRRGLLARTALSRALQDARLSDLEEARAAVVMGNAVGSPIPVEAALRARDDSLGGQGARTEGLLRDMSFHTVADEVAARCGCEGPVLTVSTGCTAGLDAICCAFELLGADDVDIAVAGSAEAPLTPMVFASFDVIGATSRRNDEPAVASRPFDRDRDGFVLAEGAALLVLEQRNRALARGARIYAEILGAASTSNAYHMTSLASDGSTVADCIRQTLADAEISPQAVDHVNAHGSSTPQNDLCESNAIKLALGAGARRVSVNSLKSMLGHALGASNAIEMAACALSLYHQRHFPTINLSVPGLGCDLDYVPGHARKASCETMLKLSNGFSGIHTAVVLRAA